MELAMSMWFWNCFCFVTRRCFPGSGGLSWYFAKKVSIFEDLFSS
jgi:hypothetical protein